MPSNSPWERTPGYRTVAAAEDLVDTDVRVGNLERHAVDGGLIAWEDVEGVELPLSWTQTPGTIPFEAQSAGAGNVFGGTIGGSAPPLPAIAYQMAGLYNADTGVFTRLSNPNAETRSGVFDLTENGIALYTEADQSGYPVAPGVPVLGPTPPGYYASVGMSNIAYPDYVKYTAAVNDSGTYLYMNWALSGGGFGYPGHAETLVRGAHWEAIVATHGNPVIVQDFQGANEPIIFESGTSHGYNGIYQAMSFLSTRPYLLNDGTVAYTYNEAIADSNYNRTGRTTLAKYWDGTSVHTCPTASPTVLLSINEKRIALCECPNAGGAGYNRLLFWDCNDFSITYLDALVPGLAGWSQHGGTINNGGSAVLFANNATDSKVVVVNGTTMRQVTPIGLNLGTNKLTMNDNHYVFAKVRNINDSGGVASYLYKPA